MKFDMCIKCNRCGYRFDIIKDFQTGLVTLRCLIEILGIGCRNCKDHDNLMIEVQEKKND
jgi:hypothetical protein